MVVLLTPIVLMVVGCQVEELAMTHTRLLGEAKNHCKTFQLRWTTCEVDNLDLQLEDTSMQINGNSEALGFQPPLKQWVLIEPPLFT